MTRILVAEDSPTQAFQIQAKLVDEGYEVLLANDGKEAFDQIPKFWPHLLLTDMEMPVMDGLDLVTEATEQYPAIPIILITAKGSDETAVNALERGAAAYLPKSMLDEKLFQTIDEVLDVIETADSYSELLGTMQYSEFQFTLQNRLELIRPLIDLVQQMVSGIGICDPTESIRVGVSLDHAVRNAMLHGNLELSRDALDSDDDLYVVGEPTMIEARSAMKEYCDRRVRVTIKMSPAEAEFVIQDDGPGFDFSLLPAEDNKDVLEADQGRGLLLIRSMMDSMTFNESGNEIRLTKRRR